MQGSSRADLLKLAHLMSAVTVHKLLLCTLHGCKHAHRIPVYKAQCQSVLKDQHVQTGQHRTTKANAFMTVSDLSLVGRQLFSQEHNLGISCFSSFSFIIISNNALQSCGVRREPVA